MKSKKFLWDLYFCGHIYVFIAEHFTPLSCSIFYSLNCGGILIDFLRRNIRYCLFIGVGLFGMTYEVLNNEPVRLPLLGGYFFVIAASVYSIWRRNAEEETTPD
ncbi:MAG: hypothetical protein ALAOOOJD_01125 [bacterium]|nr:hypothetical protein [bacterium]